MKEMADDEDEDVDTDEANMSQDEDEDEDEDEETPSKKVPSIASKEPVRLILSTNWGNSVIDQTVELTPARTRDIAAIKKSLSKQLPGRPPILALEIVYEGRILEDDTLVDELFDDEDDEDEDDEEVEEGNEPSRRLTLNILPPVDPKFATELVPKLMYHGDDEDYGADARATVGDGDSLKTEELLDAYYMNQVAMSRNAQLLADPNTPSSPFLRMESQDQARELREQLRSETPPEVWDKCMAASTKSGGRNPQEEWRGQRYRSSKGGVTTQFKTTIQTNLNVNWEDAIKHSLLFLFLGYFGGRNSFSRHLLLWGAPLSFALQARPVKMWFKTVFYMLSNPPLILLSFLPAPQQAILSMDLKSSMVALYGEDGAKLIYADMLSEADEADAPSQTISTEEDSDIEESESELEEEDEYEYDSEDEDEEESDEE